MLVVDASCLFELVARTPCSDLIRQRLSTDEDQAAPHIVDGEVLGAIRMRHHTGALDATAAGLAVEELRDWPGERFGHRLLLARAWELRDTVRSSDALYVALAEALGATLLTAESRLARATGPTCVIEVLNPP